MLCPLREYNSYVIMYSRSQHSDGNGVDKMTTHYTTFGPVRGDCGHKHKTEDAAHACASEDMDGCASQGGYSDRSVYVVTPAGREMVAKVSRSADLEAHQ